MTRISVSGGTLLSHGGLDGAYWKLQYTSFVSLEGGRGALSQHDSRKARRATLWNVGNTKDGYPATLDLLDSELTLQVDEAVEVEGGAGLDVLGLAARLVEPAVVVSGDDNLDGVRLRPEPVELALDVGGGAGVGHVAGVDEDVAGGDAHGVRLIVRVGDADNAHGGLVPRRVKGPAAEDEDDVVEERGEIC